jgi:hypothetical protein
MIEIPQVKIQKILEQLIRWVASDYSIKKVAGIEEESWLYRVFYGLNAGSFDYYKSSIEVIVNRGENSPRRLEIRRDFDRTRATLPTIFINTPQENEEGVNFIGINANLSSDEYYENEDGTTNETYGRTFRGTYELMVTSDNKDEAELIYRFLQSIFIAAGDTLSEMFDGTFKFSGKQLIPNPDVMPAPVMIRVLTIQLDSTIIVPRITLDSYLDEITFYGEAIGTENL